MCLDPSVAAAKAYLWMLSLPVVNGLFMFFPPTIDDPDVSGNHSA
jgi:hypothetical protein